VSALPHPMVIIPATRRTRTLDRRGDLRRTGSHPLFPAKSDTSARRSYILPIKSEIWERGPSRSARDSAVNGAPSVSSVNK
jgi:hypothetical protein